MKKSITLFFVILVALVSLVSCAGNNQNTETTDGYEETNVINEKGEYRWVLTKEICSLLPGGESYYEEHYGYNSHGKLASHYTVSSGTQYDYEEIKCDSEGKVISEKQQDYSLSGEKGYNRHVYTYDESGNLCSELIIYVDGSQETKAYEYDEYGTAVRETINNGTYTEKITRLPIYEDGVCVKAEVISVINEDIADGLEIYEYDENGNLYSLARYFDFVSNSGSEKITENGRVFYLFDITYYKYEKLFIEIVEEIQTSATTATTTESPKRLSSECDKVLCTGTNSEGDYYEVVSNEIEDYKGLVTYVGVIKNNEWLLEPTSEMPLVSSARSGEIYYAGQGCFVGQVTGKIGEFAPNHYVYYAYNVETKKSYSTSDWKYDNLEYVPIVESNEDDLMVIGYINYSKAELTLLNKVDMTTSTVTIAGKLHTISNVSEGVFCVAIGDSNFPRHYVYDVQGNLVLDFSEYKTYGNQAVYFIDGKCTLKMMNNNNTKYILTINRDGEVINSVKVES